MNVSAIIVTRGDVGLRSVLDSLPEEWEVLAWDNGNRSLYVWRGPGEQLDDVVIDDLAVYGRYAAIEFATHDLIYVQDDDCVVSDPAAIVRAQLEAVTARSIAGLSHDFVVCNMPLEFRHDFYVDHCLVGFGACFHRDAPDKAFDRFAEAHDTTPIDQVERVELNHLLLRTCDIVFTALTPRVLVDVPYENLPWASAPNRMWMQKTHRDERRRMLDLVLKVRDG